jgi:phosphatidylserine/phosphatidylglycerophosphate/cardiolipin synthase-like enzyme
LSGYWTAPDSLSGVDCGEPLALLASTYEFSAEFFETSLLPLFLGLKYDHADRDKVFLRDLGKILAEKYVTVLVDSEKYDVRQASRRWEQLPVRIPGGVQHSKVTVLAFENLIRLLVGSANLTLQGFRQNHEIFSCLDFYDSPGSAPLSVLNQALGFMERLAGFLTVPDECGQRVAEALGEMRARADSWSGAPRDFKPREMPRAVFRPTLPAAHGFKAESLFKGIKDALGSARVSHITVITPFQSQAATSDEGPDPAFGAVRTLNFHRRPEALFILPEEPPADGDSRPTVPFSPKFRGAADELFGDRALIRPVPAASPQEDRPLRKLHAKSIILQGDSGTVASVGSSNFTAHGLGLGSSFNAEANLIFLDCPGGELAKSLEAAAAWLKLHPQDFGADRLAWRQKTQETGGKSERPPAFFRWSDFSEVTGILNVSLDRGKTEPEDWSIGWPAALPGEEGPIFRKQDTRLSDELLRWTLPPGLPRAVPACLPVSSLSHGIWKCTRLPVLVADPDEDLLPPEELGTMTVDAILDLLADGPPDRLPESGSALEEDRLAQSRPVGDALKHVDTGNYVLYRARKLERALAAMGRAIAGRGLTPKSLKFRLLKDPGGPVRLAEKVFEASGDAFPVTPAGAALSLKVFMLSELIILLTRLRPMILEKAGDLPKIRDRLNGTIDAAIEKIERLQKSLTGPGTGLSPQGLLYVRAVGRVIHAS